MPKGPPTKDDGHAAAAVADSASDMTVVREPKSQVVPKKAGGKSLVLVGAGVLIVVLLVVGVGGFFVIKWLKPKPDGGGTGTAGTETTSATKEFGRYWIQAPTEANKPDEILAGVPLAMKSGQDFKFHFLPRQDGYLYIVGPGDKNALMAFLTAKPNAESGLHTNEVKSGQDFAFPADTVTKFHWITLDKAPGNENYTMIFSPQPLAAPAFLSSEATGEPLSETEQAELRAFLAKYRTGGSTTEINDKDAAAPFVAVKLPKATGSDAPVVFDIRIEHK